MSSPPGTTVAHVEKSKTSSLAARIEKKYCSRFNNALKRLPVHCAAPVHALPMPMVYSGKVISDQGETCAKYRCLGCSAEKHFGEDRRSGQLVLVKEIEMRLPKWKLVLKRVGPFVEVLALVLVPVKALIEMMFGKK